MLYLKDCLSKWPAKNVGGKYFPLLLCRQLRYKEIKWLPHLLQETHSSTEPDSPAFLPVLLLLCLCWWCKDLSSGWVALGLQTCVTPSSSAFAWSSQSDTAVPRESCGNSVKTTALLLLASSVLQGNGMKKLLPYHSPSDKDLWDLFQQETTTSSTWPGTLQKQHSGMDDQPLTGE